MKRLFYSLNILMLLLVSGNCAKGFVPLPERIISDRDFFIQAINSAENSLYLGTYKIQELRLPNEQILHAIKEARDRGVQVTVLLEKNLTLPEIAEEKGVKKGEGLQKFEDLGVTLVATAPKYSAAHTKVLIADDQLALVGTTNYDADAREGKSEKRDFSLVIRDPQLVSELKEVFKADIAQQEISFKDYVIKDIKPSYPQLSWGPEQHRKHLTDMIDSAQNSIDIYQQDIQDQDIVDHIVKAAHRGVNVRVLMSQYPFGEKHGNKNEASQQRILQANGQVKLTEQRNQGSHLHIHAKVLIIDGRRPNAIMYLGSTNFYPPALDTVRQVGVITRNRKQINPVLITFEKDWAS